MGTRLKGTILPGAMPWKNRYLGNPLLTWILRVLYRVKISDAHCGMRAFSKSPSSGWTLGPLEWSAPRK
jgi:hypothetical protein